jgi:hypothetical protein
MSAKNPQTRRMINNSFFLFSRLIIMNIPNPIFISWFLSQIYTNFEKSSHLISLHCPDKARIIVYGTTNRRESEMMMMREIWKIKTMKGYATIKIVTRISIKLSWRVFESKGC